MSLLIKVEVYCILLILNYVCLFCIACKSSARMIETISHVFKVARIACDLDTEKLTEACPSCIIGYRCSRPVSRKSFTV